MYVTTVKVKYASLDGYYKGYTTISETWFIVSPEAVAFKLQFLSKGELCWIPWHELKVDLKFEDDLILTDNIWEYPY